jgi:hypothetical protein
MYCIKCGKDTIEKDDFFKCLACGLKKFKGACLPEKNVHIKGLAKLAITSIRYISRESALKAFKDYFGFDFIPITNVMFEIPATKGKSCPDNPCYLCGTHGALYHIRMK